MEFLAEISRIFFYQDGFGMNEPNYEDPNSLAMFLNQSTKVETEWFEHVSAALSMVADQIDMNGDRLRNKIGFVRLTRRYSSIHKVMSEKKDEERRRYNLPKIIPR